MMPTSTKKILTSRASPVASSSKSSSPVRVKTEKVTAKLTTMMMMTKKRRLRTVTKQRRKRSRSLRETLLVSDETVFKYLKRTG